MSKKMAESVDPAAVTSWFWSTYPYSLGSYASCEMPHGGLKASGYGKDLSMYALEDYTVARHIMVTL